MNDWFDAEQRVERAQQLSESHRWEEALREIEAALEINPNNASWHAHHGFLLDELGRTEEAIRAYRQSLDLDPDDAEVSIALGVDLAKLERFSEALNIFEELARQDSDFEPAYCNRISIYTLLGRHDQAEEMFYLSQELEPDCPHCFFHIGSSLATRGQTERALYCWNRVLQIDPQYPGVRQNIARAHRVQGKPEIAKQHLLAELREDPGNPDLIFELAELALEASDFESARSKFEQILDLEPDNLDAHFELARLELALEEPAKALEHFQAIMAMDPNSDFPGFDVRYAEALVHLERYEDARKHLEDTAHRNEDDVSAKLLLGNTLLALDKGELAADQFRKVLATEPQHPVAHHHLAVCFFKRREYQRGLEHCLEAVKAQPNYILAQYKAILAHLELGQYRQAKAMLTIALQTDPSNTMLQDFSRKFWRLRLRYMSRHFLAFFAGFFVKRG